MWRFRSDVNGKTPLEHAQWMKTHLEALVGQIPEIQTLECGIDCLHTAASFDAVLTVVVTDKEALTRYANHPAHLAVAEYAKEATATRVVVDYVL